MYLTILRIFVYNSLVIHLNHYNKSRPWVLNEQIVVIFSCQVMFNSFVTPWMIATRLLCPWDFAGKRTVKWVAISFSRVSSQPRIKPMSPTLTGRFFTTEPSGKPKMSRSHPFKLPFSDVMVLSKGMISIHCSNIFYLNHSHHSGI